MSIRSNGISSTTSHPSISPIFPIEPIAVVIKVELGLTITYVVLYSFLFLMIYVQLCMILYYRHKRFSYKSFFLITSLFWVSLRIVLFTFYFHNALEATNLCTFLYWLLYCCPICLQFVIWCVMILYFSQIYFKAAYRNETHKYRRQIRLVVLIAVLIFFTTSIVCAVLKKQLKKQHVDRVTTIVMIREIICQLLFSTGGISLSIFIVKLAKCDNSNLVLEEKGLKICHALAACFCLIILFASRAVYNLIVISLKDSSSVKVPTSFEYFWINIADQGAAYDVKGNLSLSFGVILFVWEFLPTFVVVLLYRVRQPTSTPVNLFETSSQSLSSKVYFFDNPRRYDSDEDMHPSISNSSYGIDGLRTERNVNFPSSARNSYYLHNPCVSEGGFSGSNFPSSSPNINSFLSHSVPASISRHSDNLTFVIGAK